MPLFVVHCDVCGEDARGIMLEYPIKNKWCSECKQQIGPSRTHVHFCSIECLSEWIKTLAGDVLRSSPTTARENT
jgi:hypothetical protein